MKLDSKMVLSLYKILTDRTGGYPGIRDESVFLSALEAPYQTFFGEELYKTDIEKAARLCYGLISNHAFKDGNKRIGVFVMLVYLRINNVNIKLMDEEIVDIAIKTASGKYKYEDILNILKNKLD